MNWVNLRSLGGVPKTKIRITRSIRYDQIRHTDLGFKFDYHAVEAYSGLGWFVLL